MESSVEFIPAPSHGKSVKLVFKQILVVWNAGVRTLTSHDHNYREDFKIPLNNKGYKTNTDKSRTCTRISEYSKC